MLTSVSVLTLVSKSIPTIKKKVRARIESLAEPVMSSINANVSSTKTEANFALMA